MNIIASISQSISGWLFPGNIAAYEIIYMVVEELHIIFNILLLFWGYKLWKKTSRYSDSEKSYLEYRSALIKASLASLFFWIGFMEKNINQWELFQTGKIEDEILYVCIYLIFYLICSILLMVLIIKAMRSQGVFKGLVFSISISAFFFLLHYVLISILISALVVGSIAYIWAMIYGFLNGDNNSSESSLVEALAEVLEKSEEQKSQEELEEAQKAEELSRCHEWFDNKKYVHDKYDNEYEVGSSGEFVQDSSGHWRKVERFDDGTVKISGDDDGWLK